MRTSRIWIVGLISLLFIISSATVSLAGTKMYQGAWIAESFGNDKVGGTVAESQVFQFYAVPQGILCNYYAPLCTISETPVTTAGAGTAWDPRGPGCRTLSAGEKPRPAKGGTVAQGVPPLYRNPDHFTSSGYPDYNACYGSYVATPTTFLTPTTTGPGTLSTTTSYYPAATTYLPPGDSRRGKVQNGAPVSGGGPATTTGGGSKFAFQIPAATTGGAGMRRTTAGSFGNVPPYLYSYTYADLQNDAGAFGAGQGFFSVAAPTATLMFTGTTTAGDVNTITVKRGANRFGGVMKLLGSYTTKVCFFTQGGCGLGYGNWNYEDIGASGAKNFLTGSKVVTAPYTTNKVSTYYNTGLMADTPFTMVATRFPWTTGTVTVTASVRGPHNTFEQRKGFDNRNAEGVGTVQLVSPLITQWLSQDPAGDKFETGGIGVMQIQFVPEPGVAISLITGLSLLVVLKRYRS